MFGISVDLLIHNNKISINTLWRLKVAIKSGTFARFMYITVNIYYIIILIGKRGKRDIRYISSYISLFMSGEH